MKPTLKIKNKYARTPAFVRHFYNLFFKCDHLKYFRIRTTRDTNLISICDTFSVVYRRVFSLFASPLQVKG